MLSKPVAFSKVPTSSAGQREWRTKEILTDRGDWDPRKTSKRDRGVVVVVVTEGCMRVAERCVGGLMVMM
jgi:hypothetical protein